MTDAACATAATAIARWTEGATPIPTLNPAPTIYKPKECHG